jgi:hypothetical protein
LLALLRIGSACAKFGWEREAKEMALLAFSKRAPHSPRRLKPQCYNLNVTSRAFQAGIILRPIPRDCPLFGSCWGLRMVFLQDQMSRAVDQFRGFSFWRSRQKSLQHAVDRIEAFQRTLAEAIEGIEAKQQAFEKVIGGVAEAIGGMAATSGIFSNRSAPRKTPKTSTTRPSTSGGICFCSLIGWKTSNSILRNC